MRRVVFTVLFSAIALAVLHGQRARGPAPLPLPVMVIETLKGVIEIQLYQTEAPKSVAHIIELVNKSFYRGQRIHRVEASLVQFGDPASRDMTRESAWGIGGSGNPIGAAEFTKHLHVRGAVGLAHGGDPKWADSQIYIMKTASPSLDGKHVVIGRVTKGIEVVDRLVKTDVFKNVTIR